ncbi:hypothetical protein CcCBS67573_g10589 [Chytriomyces confervae]|uniref:RGS domain-containing protein n=1 Tax=Chytriomyces confervae TaxID=246404 RepID=A0A507CPX7_9FUNG|nr:hypothetical protein CcCBS67573_g10589 [Chytriomyces confervae]
MISARTTHSKSKMERFFGEQSIPVQSGTGSSAKAASFLLGIKRPRRVINTETPSLPRSSVSSVYLPIQVSVDESGADTGGTVDHINVENSRQHEPTIRQLEQNESTASLETLPNFSNAARRFEPFPGLSDLFPHSPVSTVRGLASRATNQRTFLNPRNADLIAQSELSSTTAIGFGHIDDSVLDFSITTSSMHRMPSLDRTSSRKVQRILGPGAAVDVSIKEISGSNLHQSLVNILESRLPLCYFLLHLFQSGGYEDLLFVTEVFAFEQTLFPSIRSQVQESGAIFNKFLNAGKPVSARHTFIAATCSASELRSVIAALQNGERACFAAIQSRVFGSLMYGFAQFRASATWRKMERDVGGLIRLVSSLSLMLPFGGKAGSRIVASVPIVENIKHQLCLAAVSSTHVSDGSRCSIKMGFILDEVLRFVAARLS